MHPLPLILSFFIAQTAAAAEPPQSSSASSAASATGSLLRQGDGFVRSDDGSPLGPQRGDGLSLGVAGSTPRAKDVLSLSKQSEKSLAAWLVGIFHRAWSAFCDLAADQTTADAGANDSARSVASDAGADQRALVDGFSAPVDAGLANIGGVDGHTDIESEAGAPTNPLALPSDTVDANRDLVPSDHVTSPALAGHASLEEINNAPVVAAQAAPASSSRLPILGLMADVGVPDGLIGSVVCRPWSWMRISAGGGTNSISAGWRIGMNLLPFGYGPSASLEYGRYLEGNANALAKRFAGSDFEGSPALNRIGYEYLNAALGLDLGRRDFVFFLHGGVTMIRGQLHNLGSGGSTGKTEIVVPYDPSFKASGPSLKLGLIVYLW